MPSIEVAELDQKAVLWESMGRDRFNEVKVLAAVEVDVRWIRNRRELTNAQGDPIVTDADVICDREIPAGSAMWLGELAEWIGTGSGDSDGEVMEVVSYRDTPDLKNRENRRELKLAFYKGSRPELGV